MQLIRADDGYYSGLAIGVLISDKFGLVLQFGKDISLPAYVANTFLTGTSGALKLLVH